MRSTAMPRHAPTRSFLTLRRMHSRFRRTLHHPLSAKVSAHGLSSGAACDYARTLSRDRDRARGRVRRLQAARTSKNFVKCYRVRGSVREDCRSQRSSSEKALPPWLELLVALIEWKLRTSSG